MKTKEAKRTAIELGRVSKETKGGSVGISDVVGQKLGAGLTKD